MHDLPELTPEREALENLELRLKRFKGSILTEDIIREIEAECWPTQYLLRLLAEIRLADLSADA